MFLSLYADGINFDLGAGFGAFYLGRQKPWDLAVFAQVHPQLIGFIQRILPNEDEGYFDFAPLVTHRLSLSLFLWCIFRVGLFRPSYSSHNI